MKFLRIIETPGSVTALSMRSRQRVREVLLLVTAVSLAAVGLWLWKPWSQPSQLRLRMSAGDVAGTRYKIATSLAEHLKEVGIQLEIISSEGSEQALQWVDDATIDVALVQGGLNQIDRPHVRQLCALQIEPLHLLVKPDLELQIQQQGLIRLRDKRVYLGPKQSGTRALATSVLDFIGLAIDAGSGQRSVIVEDQLQGYDELLQANVEDLPDAIFSVSLVPSPVVHELVERWDYRLTDIPFAVAFGQSGTAAQDSSLDRSLFSPCLIPAYTYGVQPTVPSQDLPTLGAHLLLVANHRVSNTTIERLLTEMFETNFGHHTIPGFDLSALDRPVEYPIHPGVEDYRDRNKVLIAGDLIDYMEKVLAIAATLAGAGFFIYQWYTEHRRSKREGRFAAFMSRVIVIENKALANEISAHLDLSDLIQLQRELAHLKAEAVEGFVAGQWQGTSMLNGLLALINDTRQQITRLILHERENIEQDAVAKKLNPDELWCVETKE